MTNCEWWNCDKPRGNKGSLRLCNAHYSRRRLGIDMDLPIDSRPHGSLLERVLRRLPAPEAFTEECFEWPGHRARPYGYGLIRAGGAGTPCARVTHVVYRHYVGDLMDGGVVMHLCDNPPCVNPKHLRAGTHADNATDKMLKGRGRKKLTPELVRAIRADPRGCTTVSREYGVSKQTVLGVRKRHTWGWVI